MFTKKQKQKKHKTLDVIPILWTGFAISLLGMLIVIFTNMFFSGQYSNWGMGVMVLGFLIGFFGLLIRRLNKKGIDYFVAGAIIAYIGFLVLALPSITFALGFSLFAKEFWNFILIFGGLFLILIGFFSETYDLNVKIIRFLNTTWHNFLDILEQVNWKLFISPWNIFFVSGVCYIVLTAIDQIPWLFPVLNYLIGAGLILLTLTIHFRKQLWNMLKSLFDLIITLLKTIGRGIIRFPNLFWRFLKWLGEVLKLAVRYTWEIFKWVIIRNYFLLFGLGIGLFFITYEQTLEFRLGLSSFVCLIAIIKPIVDNRDELGEKLDNTRLFVYKTARVPKKVLKRKYACPYCSISNKKDASFCRYCGRQLPKCYVCNMNIEQKNHVSFCPNCKNVFHHNHLSMWISMKEHCPICKTNIDKIKKRRYHKTQQYKQKMNSR